MSTDAEIRDQIAHRNSIRSETKLPTLLSDRELAKQRVARDERIFETVFVASKEQWLAKTEWAYNKAWLRQLAQSPAFRWTVAWVTEDYSEDFMAEVEFEVADALKGATQQIVGRERRERVSHHNSSGDA